MVFRIVSVWREKQWENSHCSLCVFHQNMTVFADKWKGKNTWHLWCKLVFSHPFRPKIHKWTRPSLHFIWDFTMFFRSFGCLLIKGFPTAQMWLIKPEKFSIFTRNISWRTSASIAPSSGSKTTIPNRSVLSQLLVNRLVSWLIPALY